MAPMFLVTNADMMVEANNAGISGCVPALNYRTDELFRKAIQSVRDRSNGAIGVNLIVNKSNIKFKKQIKSCVDLKVDYIITSLGSPEETIKT